MTSFSGSQDVGPPDRINIPTTSTGIRDSETAGAQNCRPNLPPQELPSLPHKTGAHHPSLGDLGTVSTVLHFLIEGRSAAGEAALLLFSGFHFHVASINPDLTQDTYEYIL